MLVLGTTEQQINVLTELDPDDLAEDGGQHPGTGPGPDLTDEDDDERTLEDVVDLQAFARSATRRETATTPTPRAAGPAAVPTSFAAELLAAEESAGHPADVASAPAAPRPAGHRAARGARRAPRSGTSSGRRRAPAAPGGGGLGGSVLSPATWIQAGQALGQLTNRGSGRRVS